MEVDCGLALSNLGPLLVSPARLQPACRVQGWVCQMFSTQQVGPCYQPVHSQDLNSTGKDLELDLDVEKVVKRWLYHIFAPDE